MIQSEAKAWADKLLDKAANTVLNPADMAIAMAEVLYEVQPDSLWRLTIEKIKEKKESRKKHIC